MYRDVLDQSEIVVTRKLAENKEKNYVYAGIIQGI